MKVKPLQKEIVIIKHKPHIVLMFMAMDVFFVHYVISWHKGETSVVVVQCAFTMLIFRLTPCAQTDLWQSVSHSLCRVHLVFCRCLGKVCVKCLCTNRVAKDKSIRITFDPDKYGVVVREGKVHNTRISFLVMKEVSKNPPSLLLLCRLVRCQPCLSCAFAVFSIFWRPSMTELTGGRAADSGELTVSVWCPQHTPLRRRHLEQVHLHPIRLCLSRGKWHSFARALRSQNLRLCVPLLPMTKKGPYFTAGLQNCLLGVLKNKRGKKEGKKPTTLIGKNLMCCVLASWIS